MSEQQIEFDVNSIPDNPVVHFSTRIGAPTSICGSDMTVAGSTYRTRADSGVTCTDCTTLLGI